MFRRWNIYLFTIVMYGCNYLHVVSVLGKIKCAATALDLQIR